MSGQELVMKLYQDYNQSFLISSSQLDGRSRVLCSDDPVSSKITVMK